MRIGRIDATRGQEGCMKGKQIMMDRCDGKKQEDAVD